MILALESSCDETAVAVFDPRRGLTGEWIQSQVAVHEAHGGVVPALAARGPIVMARAGPTNRSAARRASPGEYPARASVATTSTSKMVGTTIESVPWSKGARYDAARAWFTSPARSAEMATEASST